MQGSIEVIPAVKKVGRKAYKVTFPLRVYGTVLVCKIAVDDAGHEAHVFYGISD